MFTLKAAKKYAAEMSQLHDEPWLVFRTPVDAMCNQPPYNAMNTGDYAACPASERAEYEAGGAVFIDARIAQVAK